jgi:hypothetical protein
VTVGPGDVGLSDVGGGDIVGAGEGMSLILQFGRKLKHSKPSGQSMLRPD